ncbi:hypothetical protein MRX96_051074 [Rhipicephalus microplus]
MAFERRSGIEFNAKVSPLPSCVCAHMWAIVLGQAPFPDLAVTSIEVYGNKLRGPCAPPESFAAPGTRRTRVAKRLISTALSPHSYPDPAARFSIT